jgi:hypothetical protein
MTENKKYLIKQIRLIHKIQGKKYKIRIIIQLKLDKLNILKIFYLVVTNKLLA